MKTINFIQARQESDNPLYVYADGEVSLQDKPEKKMIGKLWGTFALNVDCCVNLEQLIQEVGLPLFFYEDGSVKHNYVHGDYALGSIWDTLDGVEPKEVLKESEFGDYPFPDVKVGWYAFAGEHFSPRADTYPDCQGVVAWVNPDKTASREYRGLIVTLNETRLALYQGHGAASLLSFDRVYCGDFLSDERAFGRLYPALEYCDSFCRNRIKQGKCFLPSLEHWEKIVKNLPVLNEALLTIHASVLSGQYWSVDSYNTEVAASFHVEAERMILHPMYETLNVRSMYAF